MILERELEPTENHTKKHERSEPISVLEYFFLEIVYSGAAHSTRPVTAHRHICNVIVRAHPRMSDLLRSINAAPSQRGRRKHKRHVGIERVHE